MNINEFNDLWIAAGQKVTDLQAKANAMVLDDEVTVEDINKIQNDISVAKAKRDLAKNNLDNARANQIAADAAKPAVPLTPAENDLKGKFVNDFIGMMKNDPKIMNDLNSSSTDGSRAGLTIPQDIQTTIHTLTRQYQALQDYVTVENVGTLSGSRNYEAWSDITPMTVVGESTKLPDGDDPKVMVIKYLIKKYGAINTVTEELLADTAENILAWLVSWISKKVTVTRNLAIINAMNTVPKKPTLAVFDDVKTLALTGVDEAIRKTSFFMTNKSGFLALSLVKDATGNYLVTRDVTNSDNFILEGKQVVVVEDRWLADSAAGTHPLYFGDLSQAVTLYDRNQMSITTTNIGAGGFEEDNTKIKVIDRFDVQPTDSDAWVAGSFKAIADQVAHIAPVQAPVTQA